MAKEMGLKVEIAATDLATPMDRALLREDPPE